MKKIALFVLMSLVLSCGSTNISGKYYPDGQSLIKYIEFKNGDKAHIVYTMLAMEVALTYEVKDDTVYITEQGKGSIPFTIIDKNTLECSFPFMSGKYVKK